MALSPDLLYEARSVVRQVGRENAVMLLDNLMGPEFIPGENQ